MTVWKNRRQSSQSLMVRPPTGDEDPAASRFRQFSRHISIKEDLSILASLDFAISHLNTVPPKSYYLNERMVLETLWTIGLFFNLSGARDEYEKTLKIIIRMSRSMSLKWFEVTAMTELLKLLGPTASSYDDGSSWTSSRRWSIGSKRP